MSVFVDTGVFYALQDEDAPRHPVARTAFERALSGSFGGIVTSEYVFDETVTLTRSRYGDLDDALAAGDRILGRDPHPDAVDLLFVDRSALDQSVEVLRRYADHDLSFTDATTIALVDRHEVDHVLAFDDDFDGIVARLDPETVAE